MSYSYGPRLDVRVARLEEIVKRLSKVVALAGVDLQQAALLEAIEDYGGSSERTMEEPGTT